jgi:hypothetical protein
MTLRSLAAFILVATVLSPVIAQEEGRRQRGGGAGGQGGPAAGGMMTMMFRGGGASSILNLLAMEEVRKEVGVAEDTYKAVSEALQDDQRKARSRDISDEERKKITESLNTKSQELMEEILPPEKQLRLKGLYAQNAGARAIINTVIAKEIGLSEDQRATLEKDLIADVEKKAADAFKTPEGERPDFRKIQESMKKLQDESLAFAEGKLTSDQKSALEKLKGEKFKFPEQRGFGGGGFGGGGRGGEQGGRGGEQGRSGETPRSGRPRGDGN